jgi:ferredoxin
MQSRDTGAVKNMFGFLTSRDRINAHTFSGFSTFSSVLVDIYSSIRPDLNIMDAVVGMEGTGPSQGKPVQLGWMLASPDAVALDAVAAAAAGFNPGEILTTSFAGKRGLGAANLDEIKVHGLNIEKARKRLKRPSAAVSALMPFLGGPLTELTQVRPRINTEECKQCRRCVEVCPAGAIDTKADFKINDNVCILCYCCHEMCEYGAVELKKPFLVKVAETLMPR